RKINHPAARIVVGAARVRVVQRRTDILRRRTDRPEPVPIRILEAERLSTPCPRTRRHSYYPRPVACSYRPGTHLLPARRLRLIPCPAKDVLVPTEARREG